MGDPEVATLLAQAQLWVATGRHHSALDALRELARSDDAVCSDHVIESCQALAARTGDHRLELHFALRRWARQPGRPSCRSAVVSAALQVPGAQEAGYRILHHVGRVEDWTTITQADPHRAWPGVDALGPAGANGALRLGQVEESGWLDVINDDDTIGWSTGPARLTRHGKSVAVGAGDGGSATSWHYIPALSTWDCSAALRWSDHPPERRHETVAVVTTQYSFSGYWHWLMEGLLKLLRLDEAGVLAHVDTCLICVDGGARAYIPDSVRAAGVEVSIDQVSGPFDITVDRLIVPGRHRAAGGIVEDLSPHDVAAQMRERARFDNARSIGVLRHRLGIDRRVRRRPGRRLLVSRGDATKRRISNEPTLLAALERHGFERLVPGSLTFDEQVATFADAEIIVAPHGAGLANLLFVSPPGAVVELLPTDVHRPHYRRLAAEVGVRYQAIPCRADPGSPLDMVADVEETVGAALALLEPEL